MELSKAQSANIEEKQTVSKLSTRGRSRRRTNGSSNTKSNNYGGGPVDRKSRPRNSSTNNQANQVSNPRCWNCGGDYPHAGGKTSCPAYQDTYRGCGKLNHFKAVCRSKKKESHQIHTPSCSEQSGWRCVQRWRWGVHFLSKQKKPRRINLYSRSRCMAHQ